MFLARAGLDQFVGLGFDLARAAIMADDSRIDLAQARPAHRLGLRA
jgi:hypothetical protein